MTSTPLQAWSAAKFAPSRCPNCDLAFGSPETFAVWAGNRGDSFVEAQWLQLSSYPELFGRPERDGERSSASTNPHRADFIVCKECQNKTLRISLEERTVATREEADELVRDDGFTCIREVELHGMSVDQWQVLDRRLREQGDR